MRRRKLDPKFPGKEVGPEVPGKRKLDPRFPQDRKLGTGVSPRRQDRNNLCVHTRQPESHMPLARDGCSCRAQRGENSPRSCRRCNHRSERASENRYHAPSASPVVQPVVLPPVLPLVLEKSLSSRNSGVPGLPGCRSGAEPEVRKSLPGGARPEVEPELSLQIPAASSQRENDEKREIPTTSRISARISQIDAPFGPAESPARVWL